MTLLFVLELAVLFVIEWTLAVLLVGVIKNLVSNPDMHYPYPLFATGMTNAGTAVLALILAQLRRGAFYVQSARSVGLPTFNVFTCFWRGCFNFKPRISFHDFLTGVTPIGLIMGVEIGLSNTALHMLSVALKTMIHACGPAGVLLTAWILGIERLTFDIQLVLLLVVGGGVISAVATAKEVTVSELGLVLAVVSLFMQGCRWSVTQIILKSGGKLKLTDVDRKEVLAKLCGNSMTVSVESPEAPTYAAMYPQSAHAAKAVDNAHTSTWDKLFSSNGANASDKRLRKSDRASTMPLLPPDLKDAVKEKIGSKTAAVTKIEMLCFMNPITAAVCFVFALIFEPGAFATPVVGWGPVLQNVLACSAFVLFKMALDLKLIQLTSAFTFSLAGVFHNLLIVLGGVVAFGDRPPLLAWIGFVVTSSGVTLYAWQKSKAGGSAGH
eukprot:TRINITY_DN3261_c0_g4_i1.p1 TRINITY_DN3261_c0_g4~~TRINITY_DN3261_c0_g4_i1.p1  ORF type:complete len:458 (+),score=58.78 TRINITY_DN3261_c0_g4_i1:58-1374(+)